MSAPPRKQKPPVDIMPLGPGAPSRKRPAGGEVETKKPDSKSKPSSVSSAASSSSAKHASSSAEASKKPRVGTDSTHSSTDEASHSSTKQQTHSTSTTSSKRGSEEQPDRASSKKHARASSNASSTSITAPAGSTISASGRMDESSEAGVPLDFVPGNFLRSNAEFLRSQLSRLDDATELSQDGCVSLLSALDEAAGRADGKEAVESLLLSALRHLRGCRVASRVPHATVSCALLAFTKERGAQYFATSPTLVDVACAVLFRDAAPVPSASATGQPQSSVSAAATPGGPPNNATRKKLGSAVCALIANILYYSLSASSSWPLATLRAYLDDALGERCWVDRPDTVCFVENLETAFGTIKARQSNPAEAAAVDNAEWNVTPRFESIRARLAPELGEAVAECVQRRLAAAQPSSSALMRIQLAGVLRVLVAASGLPAVRILATQPAFVEQCLAHTELFRATLDMLSTVAANLRLTDAEDDADAENAAALNNLVRVRLKKAQVSPFLGCLAALVDRDTRFVDALLKFAVAHELATVSNANAAGASASAVAGAPKPVVTPTNLLPICALLFIRANERASRALARCLFTAALMRSASIDLRPLRSVVREASRPNAALLSSWLAPSGSVSGPMSVSGSSLPSWASLPAGASPSSSAFDPVAFVQALTANFDEHAKSGAFVDRERERDAVRCVLELTVVCILACASPSLREAISTQNRVGSAATAQTVKSGLLQIASIQAVAVGWLLRSPSATRLAPPELYAYIRTVLFLLPDAPDADEMQSRTAVELYFSDGWPPEAERAAVLRACAQVPLLEDTLCALLDFASAKRASPASAVTAASDVGGAALLAALSPYEVHATHLTQIVSAIVLRCLPLASLRIAELDASLVRVERQDVVELLLALANVVDKRASIDGGRFAVSNRYWKVALALVVLAAHNTQSVGRVVWSGCATVRTMIEMCIVNSFTYPPSCSASDVNADCGNDELQQRALEREAILAFESAIRGKPVDSSAATLLGELTLVNESRSRAPPSQILAQLAQLNETGRLDLAFCRQRDPDLVLELLARGRVRPPTDVADTNGESDDEHDPGPGREIHFEARSEVWIVRLVQNAGRDLLDSLPVECLCEFVFATDWMVGETCDEAASPNDVFDQDEQETCDVPQASGVVTCISRVRDRMNASRSDALAVTRFAADRLRARHANQRRKTRSLLAALSSSSASSTCDWLEEVTRAPFFADMHVETALLEAIGRSLLVETDVRVVIRSLVFLRDRLDAHFAAPASASTPQAENVVVSVARCLCNRPVLRSELEQKPEALEAIFSLLLAYLRKCSNRTHRDRHGSAAQLVALRWNTSVISPERKAQLVLDRRVVRATTYLLAVPHPLRAALTAFWLPPDASGEPATPFGVSKPNSRSDLLHIADTPLTDAALARLYPSWLFSKLVSAFEVHCSLALVGAALRAASPSAVIAALHVTGNNTALLAMSDRLLSLSLRECDALRHEFVARNGNVAWLASCRRALSILQRAGNALPERDFTKFLGQQLLSASAAVSKPRSVTMTTQRASVDLDVDMPMAKVEPTLPPHPEATIEEAHETGSRDYRTDKLLDGLRRRNITEWVASDPKRRIRALFSAECQVFVGELLHDYDLPAIQRLIDWLLDSDVDTDADAEDERDRTAQFCTVALDFVANAHNLPRFWLGCERESVRQSPLASASCISISTRQLARIAQLIVREALTSSLHLQLARMANRVRFALLPFIGNQPGRARLHAVVNVVRQYGALSAKHAAVACHFGWLAYQFCPQLGSSLPVHDTLTIAVNGGEDTRLASVAGQFDKMFERLLFDFCSPLTAYVAPEYQQAAQNQGKAVGRSGVGVVGVSGTPSTFGVTLDDDRLRRGNVLLRALGARHPLLLARHLHAALAHVTDHSSLYSFTEFQRRRFDTLHSYLLNLVESILPWLVEFDARRIDLLASADSTRLKPEASSVVLGYTRVCFALLNAYRATMCREMGGFVIRFLRVLSETRTLLVARCAGAFVCTRCNHSTRLAHFRTLLVANIGVLHGLREVFADSETLHASFVFAESASASASASATNSSTTIPEDVTCRCPCTNAVVTGDAQLVAARKRESAFHVHRFLKRFADRHTTQLELIDMLKDLDDSSMRRVEVLERFQPELKALICHQHDTIRSLATSLAMRFIRQYPQRAAEFHDAFMTCLQSSSPSIAESALRVLPEFATLNYERAVDVMSAAFDSIVQKGVADDSCTFLDEAFTLLSANVDPPPS